MLFLHIDRWGDPSIFPLEKIPQNEEEFLKEYGYPVEPYIVIIDNITDEEEVVAEPDEIGWMDEGDFTDDLVDIDHRHFNRILSAYGGELELEMTDDESVEGNITPVLVDDKIVIRYPEEEEEEEEE